MSSTPDTKPSVDTPCIPGAEFGPAQLITFDDVISMFRPRPCLEDQKAPQESLLNKTLRRIARNEPVLIREL